MSGNIPNPEQWRRQLSAEQYHVCWEKGTERPYSGALLHNRKSGDYLCVCCKQVLFHSDAKFDSGCGVTGIDLGAGGVQQVGAARSLGPPEIEER